MTNTSIQVKRRGRKPTDIAGQRFGKLTAISRTRNERGRSIWRCICDCGNERTVDLTRLTSGEVTGCTNCSTQTSKRKVISENLDGRTFGYLTVASTHLTRLGSTKCVCKCVCGNTVEVYSSVLLRGDQKSCGCMNPAHESTKRSRRHNDRQRYHSKRLYRIWGGMKQRCYNPNSDSYKNYGGRGIAVCDEWLHDFDAFERWAIETGYDETAPRGECTIDRIDVDGDYSPDNCRWASMAEQCKNKRTTK